MAEIIAIACALCGGAASASAAPTPTPPAATAVSVSESPGVDPAAPVQQDMRADSLANPVAETSSSDTGATGSGSTGDAQPSVPAVFGETSSAPTFRTEAIIGTAAKPAPVPAPVAPGLHRIPQRFGGLPDAGSTPDAPRRPRLSVGEPIAVTTMHVVRDNGTLSAMRDPDCAVQVLHAQPAEKAREVGTLSVDGAPAQHEDILSLVRHRACEAGANAVLIKSTDKKQVDGVRVDHVEAVALVLGTPAPPADPAPVPKTITVTPDGPAVPKIITVDPGPSR